MFNKCANPNCSASFDYRVGKIYLFRQDPGDSRLNAHAVRHYWLCGECVVTYALVDRREEGIALRLRSDFTTDAVATQEVSPAPPIPRRLPRGPRKSLRKRPAVLSVDPRALVVATTSSAV